MSIQTGGILQRRGIPSAYVYNETFQLNNVDLSKQTIATSGEYTLELLGNSTLPAGVQVNNDFYIDYEGFIILTADTSVELEVDLLFTQTLRGRFPFMQRREYAVGLSEDIEATVPLNVYSLQTMFRAGTIPGTNITLSPEDFAQPTTIRLDLGITGFRPRRRPQRKLANVDIRARLVEVNFTQFATGTFMAPPVVQSPGQLIYGVYDQSEDAYAESGTVEITSLPGTVEFESPLTSGTDNQWWFITPPGVSWSNLHYRTSGAEPADRQWRFDNDYTGPGRRFLSDTLGVLTNTSQIRIFIDLIRI